MVQNKGFIYKSIPSGFPVVGKDIAVEDSSIDLDQNLPPDSLLVQNHYLSYDPYIRGRMRPAEESYFPPLTLGQPVVNRGISTVLKSTTAGLAPGDLVEVLAGCPFEEYSVLPPSTAARVRKLDNPYNLDPTVFLGALGMPGLTAYSSFYEIGEPKKGETIFISAASGAVGQLVGQLAKHDGLTVIGSVGDDAKVEWIINELGFDAGFNYKKEKPRDALKRLAPQGIDIYYENVGGETLEAAIDNMNWFGRIIACGMISGYNIKPEENYPIRNLFHVVGKRLKMQGFVVMDANMGPKWADEHRKNISKWIADGTFQYKVSVTEGIDNAAEGFIGMLSGKNFGKAILQISEPKK
ncbi:putative oxidoreductase [Lineolata rhizophorae]|uniref:Putative oxidoreductase n=1 Tax=Lineolata rhizophorae TaxID=578093 RepID=A0A6A6P2F2_9PEZI|nr:putative oxidoreductase [Lineolata rhizophorae]